MPASEHYADLLCPLCGGEQVTRYHQDKRRSYMQCSQCQLVFVPSRYHLSIADEKALYDQHENHVDDAHYRQFLSRLATPLMAKLSSASTGLDFGCGPGPALMAMFSEQGFTMQGYDCFYADNKKALQQQYDFICLTEVIEHLSQPAQVLEQLLALLKPNAHLGVMTKTVNSPQAFDNWHYKNDLSHICFFSAPTWQYLCQQYGLAVEQVADDAFIFQKLNC